jgi:hypothetical protein
MNHLIKELSNKKKTGESKECLIAIQRLTMAIIQALKSYSNGL